MSTRSTLHHTFVIERNYPVAPARVFKAFASKEAKTRWFVGPGWSSGPYDFDFRVGGREHVAGGPAGGPVHTFNCIYQDIVPDERIIYTYDMHLDDKRISVSLAAIELQPEGAGTRLTVTEHGIYLDGFDIPADRERGTRELLDNLAAELKREPAKA